MNRRNWNGAVYGTTVNFVSLFKRWLATRCFLASAVVVVLFGSACAPLLMWRGAGKLPDDAYVLPVEGLRQVGNRCGPNTLAMLLSAAGDNVSEAQVAAEIQNKTVDAALTIDLLLYARRRGFPADFERGNEQLLIRTLSEGKPTILLLNLARGSPWPIYGQPLWHYVVVYGFSLSERLLFVHSGVGPKRLSFDKLDNMWRPAGFWMMHLGIPLNVQNSDDQLTLFKRPVASRVEPATGQM